MNQHLFWANSYLCGFEFDIIPNLINKAINFKNASRFNSFYVVCFNELLQGTFLDLVVNVIDGIHDIIYYPFSFARIPNLSGNIPAYAFNGSNLFKFLRLAKCTLKLFVFLPKAKQLLSRMMNHGANQVTLLKQVKQAIKQHITTFNSFNVSTKEILTKILDHT